LDLKKQKPQHLELGEKAEDRAHQFLVDKGLKTVCRNYRCKVGEIDLIMQDGDSLVMVEVRYRKSDTYGSAVESITRKKQKRIIAAAGLYLVVNNIDKPVRFDVIAISGNQSLNWITNAFQVF
jgi:putative endonuclease